MNTYTKNSRCLSGLICSAGLLTLLVSSCAKNTIDYNTTPPAITAVTFIQASPDEPLLSLFFGNTKIAVIDYGQTAGRFQIGAGKYPITVYNDVTLKPILADTITFGQDTSYSLFFANKPSQPEFVLLTDPLSKPSTGNAGVRFVDLSPDAPAVDLVVNGGAVLSANQSYKGYSSFVPVTGGMLYTIEVHQAGTSNVLATLTKVELDAGYLYTIWFHGLAAGTTATDQLKVDIMTNAFYL